MSRSFLSFLENSVVYSRNLDTWEFGKGALSGLRFWGAAVGPTRTRFTSTNTILYSGLRSAVFGPSHHEHESQWQTSTLGIPGKLENEL